MRLGKAGNFRERQFGGRETKMDDYSRYDGWSWAGFIHLNRRQPLAPTLGHAAALGCEPGGGGFP
jgi:hypothetical protein